MLKFYYNPAYKYTNRMIIDVSSDTNYTEHDYENIDSPDTINGHIIYVLGQNETIPTYVVDTVSGWRWFVSGITQLRTGKFQISLLRDIISESPNTWKQEQAYITAGTATNYNKYKRWDLPYTNTKIGEERLNINGKSSFFVYYVNEQTYNNNIITEDDLHMKYSSIPGVTNFDYEVSDLSEIPSYEYIDAGRFLNWVTLEGSVEMWNPNNNNLSQLRLFYTLEAPNYNNYAFLVLSENADYGTIRNNVLETNINGADVINNINNTKTQFQTAVYNYMESYKQTFGSVISQNAINNLSPYVGKIIHDTSTNKVYRLIKNNVIAQSETSYLSPPTLYSALNNITWPNGQQIYNSYGNWFKFYGTWQSAEYVLEELGTATSFEFTFKANVRKLPKSAVRCINIVSDTNHTDEEIAQCLMLAQTNGINPDNTTGRILDIQYLPFSIAEETDSNIKINNTALIAQFLDLDDYQYDINLTDLTNINKETDTIKIVSPSRASQYLFRPYDNGGNMEFAARITLKPYTSTIYIRPSTKGLLMYDWEDKDCLIIQEDFSLTNVSSEWTQYIYQNRTYLNAFERQIQGRDYERTWERRVEQAQAKSDDWNSRNISAQKAKTYTGNIPIISNIASAIGTAWQDDNYMKAAQLDREYNEALYQEGMSLSRDLFEYQLENIKSQPLIPSKVTTIDCKFLDGVYLEFYSTNETELNAINNFYKYNGNRIDDYGTFADYWGNFVKGKIIISANYTQPEIDELNRRLSMGIFTTGGIL